MDLELAYTKIGKGTRSIIRKKTNSRSVTILTNSHQSNSAVSTELESLRNRNKEENKHKEEGKGRMKLDIEERKNFV